MAIEPIKIPQNVYIEDRIVGPLTLKQIITVAIGCGFSYALYSMIIQSYGKIALPVTVMIWAPGALSFVFAFVKINDLSMLRLCLLAMERINKPAVRTWSPRRGISINIRTFTAPSKKKAEFEAGDPQTDMKMKQIHELSAILDKTANKEMEEAALSPLEEPVDESPATEPVPAPAPAAVRPVDPTRISVSPIDGVPTDMVAAAPSSGSVSIFRDIAPRS